VNTTPLQSSTLADLQRDLVRTHRARLARRRAIGAAAVTLPALALAFAVLPVRPPGSATLRVASSPATSEFRNPQSAIRNSFVTIVTTTAPVPTMTDDELLAALAETGQPSGLITINGTTTVVPNRIPDAMFSSVGPASTRSSITADPQ